MIFDASAGQMATCTIQCLHLLKSRTVLRVPGNPKGNQEIRITQHPYAIVQEHEAKGDMHVLYGNTRTKKSHKLVCLRFIHLLSEVCMPRTDLELQLLVW